MHGDCHEKSDRLFRLLINKNSQQFGEKASWTAASFLNLRLGAYYSAWSALTTQTRSHNSHCSRLVLRGRCGRRLCCLSGIYTHHPACQILRMVWNCACVRHRNRTLSASSRHSRKRALNHLRKHPALQAILSRIQRRIDLRAWVEYLCLKRAWTRQFSLDLELSISGWEYLHKEKYTLKACHQ